MQPAYTPRDYVPLQANLPIECPEEPPELVHFHIPSNRLRQRCRKAVLMDIMGEPGAKVWTQSRAVWYEEDENNGRTRGMRGRGIERKRYRSHIRRHWHRIRESRQHLPANASPLRARFR